MKDDKYIKVRKKWHIPPETRIIFSKKIYNRARDKQYILKEIKTNMDDYL